MLQAIDGLRQELIKVMDNGKIAQKSIERSIEAGLDAPVPFIATIIGEGGSGGAIALAAADRVVMLEHAVYSVISPEGCASILWRDAAQASTAAEALRLTAEDLRRLNLVDAIVAEPLGGAHRNADALMAAVGDKVWSLLEPLLALDGATLRARRREKFLEMGRGGVM
jgi:acetyl-CoA carboxylase carboxyl transferase subunit alpha